jgi:hypothetical protein
MYPPEGQTPPALLLFVKERIEEGLKRPPQSRESPKSTGSIPHVANAAYIGALLIEQSIGNFAHIEISSILTELKVEDDGRALTYIEELTQYLGVGTRGSYWDIHQYVLVSMTAIDELRAYKVGKNCMLTRSFMSTNMDLFGPVALSVVEFDGKMYVNVGNVFTGKVTRLVRRMSLFFINSAVGPTQEGAIYGSICSTLPTLGRLQFQISNCWRKLLYSPA